MKKRLILLIALVSVLAANVKAQGVDKEAIQLRAAEMVAQFGDYLNYIADTDKSAKARQYYCKNALKLFIGNGDDYTLGGKFHKGVTMQTTSLNRPTPRKQLMKTYLTNLMNSKRYAQVKIETTEVGQIKVSDVKKIGEDLYECTCYIEQKFIGYGRDGRARYADMTRKSVKCYITVDHTVDGDIYIVKLGDVTATHTERLKN